jgi:hypothetical protein
MMNKLNLMVLTGAAETSNHDEVYPLAYLYKETVVALI